MKTIPIVITARLWLWTGKGAWHFITIEKSDADFLRQQYIWPSKGFGSIPVKVTIGKTNWKTSIFPEKAGNFLLPVKRMIRDKEQIKEGDILKVTVEVFN